MRRSLQFFNGQRTYQTRTYAKHGYSFGVIGGGTPHETAVIVDFVKHDASDTNNDSNDKKAPLKPKPMIRSATAQGTAQEVASENRIGRGNANTIKEKPKDERIGQRHLLDKLRKQPKSGAGSDRAGFLPSFAFCGVGGLDDKFGTLFRRVFASRMIDPQIAKKMELEHVRGVLLYGPPGTGKTLVAKALGELLNAHPPKIVNGPEILQRFVGQSEENIRSLFADAELEYRIRGDESKLHVIVFDEIDAICKARGSGGVTASVVHDNVVNQLLTKLDGMRSLNNILVVGITNRRDLLDKALLRPGRLELQLEIGLPDAYGRLQILEIHTKAFKSAGTLSECVDLERLAQMTENHSGAELKGLVRAATSHALSRHLGMSSGDSVATNNITNSEEENPKVTMEDFKSAMKEFVSAMKQDAKEVENIVPENFFLLEKQSEALEELYETLETLKNSGGGKNDGQNVGALTQTIIQVRGIKDSGKTTIICKAVTDAKYPHARILSAHDILRKVEDPTLLAQTVIFAIKSAFDDAAKGKLSAIIIDDLDVLLGVDRATGRIPEHNKEMSRVVLEYVRTVPEKGSKFAVIVTTNKTRSSSSLTAKEIIESTKHALEEGETSLFEDYPDDDDATDDDYDDYDDEEYTELDFMLQDAYVSRIIELENESANSAVQAIARKLRLPDNLSQAISSEIIENECEDIPVGKLIKLINHANDTTTTTTTTSNAQTTITFSKAFRSAFQIV